MDAQSAYQDAERLAVSGLHQEAAKKFRLAAKGFATVKNKLRATAKWAEALCALAKHAEAERHLREVLPECETTDDGSTRALVFGWLGRATHFQERDTERLGRIKRAVAVANKCGDPGVICLISVFLGRALPFVDRDGEAEGFSLRVVVQAENVSGSSLRSMGFEARPLTRVTLGRTLAAVLRAPGRYEEEMKCV